MKKIENIQILRLIAAIGIILFHSGTLGYFGYFGVEIFNIISGFVMMYSTQMLTDVNTVEFVKKKLFRIIPLYWIWTLIMDILLLFFPWISTTTKHGMSYLMKSLFFIPFTNDIGYRLPIVGVGWTLTYEVAFILIFSISMRISHKYRGAIASAIIIMLWVINILWNNVNPNTINFYYSNSLLLEFIYGIILFYILENAFICKYMKQLKALAVGLCVIGYGALICLSHGYEMGRERGIILGSVAFVFVFAFLKATDKVVFPKGLVHLGDMTYSIYLAEFFSTGVYRVVVRNMNIKMKILAIIPLFIVTIIISEITFHLIEKKKLQKKIGTI